MATRDGAMKWGPAEDGGGAREAVLVLEQLRRVGMVRLRRTGRDGAAW